ncbi:MAG: hypothetical protein JXK16_02910 [Thiotrichales bacterium]|nr:hypothetical protein [Thiotrichales bacterium]
MIDNLIYPFSVVQISDDPIKLPPKGLQTKKVLALVKNSAQTPFYTYATLDNNEIDVVSYSLVEMEAIKADSKNIIPFNEFCRSHYLANGFSSAKIYVSFTFRVVALVRDGRLTSYHFIDKSEDESATDARIRVADSAKKTEARLMKTEGKKAEFVCDELLDSFQSSLFNINDPAILKSVTGSQKLTNPRIAEIRKNKTMGHVNAIKKNSALLGFTAVTTTLVLAGAYAMKPLFQLETTIDKVSYDVAYLSDRLVSISALLMEINKKTQLIEESTAMLKLDEENSPGSEDLLMKIDNVQNNLNNVLAAMSAMSAQRGLPSAHLTPPQAAQSRQNQAKQPALNPQLEHFMCKPLLISMESVTCLFQGRTVEVPTHYVDIREYRVKYNPEKREFQQQKDGLTKITSLSMAERGF